MLVIEITENKVEHLAETVGKMLHYVNKAMECIEGMRHGGSYREEGRIGHREDEENRWYERERMGERKPLRSGRYGMREEDYDDGEDERMNERYPRERWEDYPPYMNERRGRDPYTGRYVRR